jgi:haloalkane dehalogenase
VRKHRSAGRQFAVGGASSFVLQHGDGPPVVCLHGALASSFLYRKLLPALAAHGLRGVAFDLPGLGLAERPDRFDYSWSGLSAWTGRAIDALGIDRCHLVLHGTGGPVGFGWAIAQPDRVLSVTALNTVVDVAGYRRPFPVRQLTVPVAGRAWLALLRPPVSRLIFRRVGLADPAAVTNAEIDTYAALLRRGDRGRAFLRIMRGSELTSDKQTYFYEGLAALACPAQVIWGRDDPALGDARRQAVQDALGVDDPVLLPGRHFIPEEQAPAIAAAVAGLAASQRPGAPGR